MAATLKITKSMQYVILGVILVCFAIFAVINFIVVPIVTTWKVNIKKTRELEVKLTDERAVAKTRQAVQQQVDEAQARIRQLSAGIPLPVLGNYLLGMEEQIRACAGDLDVQIGQVVGQDVQELEATGFRVYRVRVPVQAGLHSLIQLFRKLQDSNPMLSISGLTISPRAANPDKHEVSFTVAWLIWVDAAQRPAFLLKKQAGESATGNNPEP